MCDRIPTDWVLTVHIRETDWKPVSALLFHRLTHPPALMHGVIFLPLTAPLAAADTNRMRKQDARLDVVEVAEEY